jgi:16S rRNA (cytosine1402-N4)-methyltransferase
MNTSAHTPVLFEEVVQALELSTSNLVVDATYGRGGHASAIYEKLGERGQLIVIDRDQDAIKHAQEKWQEQDNIEIIHSPFSDLKALIEERGLVGKVDAILFDFGVSSPQLDESERGFSFSSDGPLDMRMDARQETTALSLIETTKEQELARLIKAYGDERFSKRVARAIKEANSESTIETTAQLAKIVSDAIPFREKGKHPATRTFQALRIAVNEELKQIQDVLPQALEVLAPGGRLVVISFHSLEDRIVKRFFRSEAKGDPYPLDLPVTQDMINPALELVGKQTRAGETEVDRNPRARSAVMRVARKVA